MTGRFDIFEIDVAPDGALRSFSAADEIATDRARRLAQPLDA